jgi:hypothetical protein
VVPVLVLFAGCAATTHQNVQNNDSDNRQSYLTTTYVSTVKPGAWPSPVSLCVSEVTMQPPQLHIFPGVLLEIFPVLSFFAVWRMENRVGKYKITQADIRQLIAGDLQRSGLSLHTDSTDRTGKAGFTVRTTFQLLVKRRIHCGGFGAVVGIGPLLLFPMKTDRFQVKASFEVVAAGTGKIVFSKEYRSTLRKTEWIYNLGSAESNLPRTVLPEIIGRFVNDVRALPAETWNN